MIREIKIRNLALIRDLTIQFDKGFSVFTGETGAGKSILLGAIGLLLGERGLQAVAHLVELACQSADFVALVPVKRTI